MRLEKCKTREGYRVFGEKPFMLERLRSPPEPYELVLWTPVAVCFRYKENEIIAHHFGELHFKHDQEISVIRQSAEEIWEFLHPLLHAFSKKEYNAEAKRGETDQIP